MKTNQICKSLVFIIFGILLINLISATTTVLSGTPTSFNLNPGDTSTSTISYSIDNLGGLSGAKGVVLTGSPRFISYSGGSISYGTNNTTNGNIVVNVGIPLNLSKGDYINSVIIDEQIVNLNIKVNDISQPGQIIVFPTSKVVNVKKDEIKNQKIQLIVPISYPESIIIQSVDFNPEIGVLSFGDLDLGIAQPGQTINIPLIIDATDVELGNYETDIIILATNPQGQINLPKSNIQITVSQTTNPLGSQTFSTPPTCSLSSAVMNLNSTYSFTCSGVQNNLEINPQYNNYFEGISVDISSGIYSYTFRPIKYGNTNFVSLFTYRGSPVFTPFNQEIKIQASGGVAGSNLKFIFTPLKENIISNQEVILQLADDKTGNLVENPEIYINGNLLSNISGKSFYYTFNGNQKYELRGISLGYFNLLENFSITSQKINYTISSEIFMNTPFTIDTTPVNASIFIWGTQYTNPITLNSAGNTSITLKLSGYIDTTFNIDVKKNIGVLTNPTTDDLKKGREVKLGLTEIVDWKVMFQSLDGNTPEELNRGTGDLVSFKMKEYGSYMVMQQSDDKIIWNYVLEKGKSNWKTSYWYYLIGAGLLIGVFYWFYNKKLEGDSSVGFELNPKE